MNTKEEMQVKILKDEENELLENEQLETLEGGDCTCDCWISNSNSGPDQQQQSELK